MLDYHRTRTSDWGPRTARKWFLISNCFPVALMASSRTSLRPVAPVEAPEESFAHGEASAVRH